MALFIGGVINLAAKQMRISYRLNEMWPAANSAASSASWRGHVVGGRRETRRETFCRGNQKRITRIGEAKA